MKKNNIILLTIVVITLISLTIFATYAYFANNVGTSDVTNLTATSERNNMVFDTLGGGMLLNVTASNMTQANNNTIASENNTTLTVTFQANTSYSMVCSYDIIYEWTSEDKYQAHTQGVTDDEFTIQASLTSNAHVSQGTNSIASETDLVTAVGNQNSATVVSGAQIDSTGTSTSTAVWTITGKFYNLDVNQNDLSDKTYEGSFKVGNVSCVEGTVMQSPSLSYWFATGDNYAFPNYGGTLYSTGLETGHNVYLKRGDDKHYTCATINGHEICLSQPYTQYGLLNHIPENNLSLSEQESAKQAMYDAYRAAGINVDFTNDCNGHQYGAGCQVDSLSCQLNLYGNLICSDYDEGVACEVKYNGNTYCHWM